MTLHSFFLENIHLTEGSAHTIFEKDHPEWFHQISRVLRMKVGKQAYLLNNMGSRYEIEFTDFSKKDIKILCKKEERRERLAPLVLYTPMIKLSRLETLLDMATQLAVTHFQFFQSDFTDAENITQQKKERLKRIVQEAAEQSEQFFVPTIDFSSAPFEEMITENDQIHVAIEPRRPTACCVPNEIELKNTAPNDTNFRNATCGEPNSTNVMIGPEGGWSPREKEIFEKDPRFIPLDLHCDTILRAETAAVVALASVHSMLWTDAKGS